MQAGMGTHPYRRHRLRLGENLGILADADLQILRPCALGDQHGFQPHGFGRAGFQPRQVIAHQRRNFRPDGGGGAIVAARLLLDHPLQHRHGEGDAGGLDGLQVHRGQQPGPG